MNEDEDTN